MVLSKIALIAPIVLQKEAASFPPVKKKMEIPVESKLHPDAETAKSGSHIRLRRRPSRILEYILKPIESSWTLRFLSPFLFFKKRNRGGYQEYRFLARNGVSGSSASLMKLPTCGKLADMQFA